MLPLPFCITSHVGCMLRAWPTGAFRWEGIVTFHSPCLRFVFVEWWNRKLGYRCTARLGAGNASQQASGRLG